MQNSLSIGKRVKFRIADFGSDGKPIEDVGTVIDEGGWSVLIETLHGYMTKRKEDVEIA